MWPPSGERAHAGVAARSAGSQVGSGYNVSQTWSHRWVLPLSADTSSGHHDTVCPGEIGLSEHGDIP